MTSYGTIPSSSSPEGGIANLEYMSRAKERLTSGLDTRRPWKKMFDLHLFGLPTNFSDAVSRVKSNVAYFRMNYVQLVLSILYLSLILHPLLTIWFPFVLLAWQFLYFLRDKPLVILGRMISDLVVLVVLAVVTVVLLLLTTHATTNILVSLLVGVVGVLIHAAFRKTDDLYLDEEAPGFLHAPSSVPAPPASS